MPYYRILHILNDPYGLAGQSEQLTRALEDGGHGVTALRPADNPWMFDGDTLREGALLPFFRHGAPDLVLVSDGVRVSATDLDGARKAKSPVLRIDASGAVEVVPQKRACGESPGGFPAGPAGTQPLFAIEPSVSRSYRETELANFVCAEPCVLCVQERTPERERILAEVRDRLAEAGSSLRVACVGPGWDVPVREHAETALAYASRAAVVALVFPGDDASALAVPLADGIPLIAFGCETPAFADAGAAVACDSAKEVARAAVDAQSRMVRGGEWEPAVRGASLLAVEPLDDQAARLLSCLREVGLVGAGSERPAVYATLCGYYGTGNFGDEAILDHLAHRIEARCGLAVVRAIAADVEGTWRDHGIEAMALGDHVRVERALSQSKALVVTAGLLFDQGMRWTCGLGSLAAHAFATDLPGLEGLVALARACRTPVLFYGTGDGPLHLEASRRCVELAAELGARFFTRNEDSAVMLEGCDLPVESVVRASDALYGLDDPGDARARAWADGAGIALDATKLLVVALRAWPGLPEGWQRFVARQLDRVADAGATVVFVDFSPEDAPVHDEVAALMARADRCVRYGLATDRAEVVSLLSAAWAGFAMRLHCSLVLGRFGKPSVGIAYLPKVAALFEQLGEADLLVPVSFSETQLANAVDSLVARRDAYAEEVRVRAQHEREKLGAATDALNAALDAPRDFPERRFWYASESAEQLEHDRVCWLEGRTAQLEARIHELEAACAAAVAERDELRASHAFRIGHAITKPLSKLKRS